MKRGFTIRDNKIIADEDRVHYQVVKYLKLRWPKVLFHTDSAGELMFESQRMRQGKLNHSGISFPDLQILDARGGFLGLLIEMKREGEICTFRRAIQKRASFASKRHPESPDR